MLELPPEGTVAAAIAIVLITIFATKFGGILWRFFTWPFRYIVKLIYTWIAPRNPLSISLRTYKRALRRSHLARMENPVGPGLEIPLAQAYAPLKLLSRGGNESIDLFDFTSTCDRMMVLGGPGSGKTTLMKNLIMSIANKRCDP